ncbi:MAG: Autophagy protein 22 [Alectoria sarmentosa]|nr:MAG: Autophagy protein 22 [Alectoria sarmentosa]
MDPGNASDPPSYPGEDTRLTSTKELSGWYSYGWAAEVFVVCGVGSFIPITLEQLARERGVLLSDRTVSCSARFKTTMPTGLPNMTMSYEAARVLSPRADKGQCIINFFGTDINTASFAMYTFSISVLVQALLIISMSGAADHGRYRKSLLLSFAFIGAVATMFFLAVVPKVYALGALLAIISNTCFGASFVLLNSFLPVLVRRHPSIQAIEIDGNGYSERQSLEQTADHENQGHDSATESLLQSSSVARRMVPIQTSSAPVSPALRLSTKISSYGIGIGYIAAVIVQTLGITIVVVADSMITSTTLTLRIVLFLVGLWWFIFTIPAALWLRPRPGPPLPSIRNGKQRSWAGYIAYAWRSLGKTILRARHLKDVTLFLGAWLLLSDGIATVSGTAVLFAKTELQMTPAALALISLVGTVAGILGAFSWSKLVGIPESSSTPRAPPLEFLFGDLIPPGSEAAFYALYAITDKGSSVFGPAIVGAITDRYGEIRPAFVFLAVLIFIPLPLMSLVDVDRGKRDGAEMAKELEGKDDALPTGSDDTIRLVDEEEDE